ncbi:type 4a pilus biogenesis protein PilO [Clostridium tertium]|uniref:type 4a pilus biogenesis protein PilO n=2 Tax=Clostridiaceae TaxID=31979 RepID=UPI001158A197|nr:MULTISPECIES: type 4a pilus biogenesis protein PilO [Clostridium]MBS5306922.1 type 4a pilus biogenesis protein PilO [Clostridium sp.]MDB1921039.1 type 4a pilus biogenesis protein PilO [Clostridium tertium]MDB1925263.1 type 4a pilus biogenesis protein PilO [Clostridium tertium]MDB1928652.1 type 4a pilus biogenesis protein PilO [Clostridium tertium]MDB1943553.1 type 4a pilus biogenesis protein PilO [Clostridium tertium]
MNISKREKYLIGILLTVLICFVYYQFIYTKQVGKLATKRAEKNQVEQRYNDVMDNISKLDSKEENLKILKSTVLDKSKSLYPTIMQEKIIIELDKLLNDSGLKGNIAFSPVEVASVEKMVSPEIQKAESSLKAIADEYSGDATKDETSNIESNNENNNTSTEGNEGQVPQDSQEVSPEQNGATSEQLKVAINFSGSYESLKKFISSVQNYERKIVITNITISSKSQEELTGVMNLEFHAVPKLSDEDMEYLIWTLNNVYGKEILFSSGAASGAYASTIEEQNNKEDINDFVMMLRSSLSELPTVTIGRAKDESRESYIYSDNDKVEEVEISFDEANGKTYYKYKTAGSYYPKDNSSEGKEFTSKSDDIVLEIISEKRGGSSDNSGIKLKVVNNTSKNIEIIIKDDDTTNPRVSVTSEGNTVNVTKK